MLRLSLLPEGFTGVWAPAYAGVTGEKEGEGDKVVGSPDGSLPPQGRRERGGKCTEGWHHQSAPLIGCFCRPSWFLSGIGGRVVLRCSRGLLGSLMGPCLRRDDGARGMLRLPLLPEGFTGVWIPACAGMTGDMVGGGDVPAGKVEGGAIPIPIPLSRLKRAKPVRIFLGVWGGRAGIMGAVS